MILPLLLAAAFPAETPADDPRTYLVSIAELPLEKSETLMGFEIETWGVRFVTVCHIPPGWRITAGGSATPDGVLAGSGSHGATWFGDRDPPELRDLALIELSGPVAAEADGEVPATFAGRATISTRDDERTAPLDYRNVRLRPAAACPTQ